MTDDVDPLAEWWRNLIEGSEDRKSAIHAAYQAMENAGVLNKVTVHRYICKRQGCGVIGTVIRVSGQTIARTRDNRYSPGLNMAKTVESARRKNTLDGVRHWPGQTVDIDELATLGPQVGIEIGCWHVIRSIRAIDVLAVVKDVRPGHPGKPTLI